MPCIKWKQYYKTAFHTKVSIIYLLQGGMAFERKRQGRANCSTAEGIRSRLHDGSKGLHSARKTVYACTRSAVCLQLSSESC